jgi:hypothetical protein
VKEPQPRTVVVVVDVVEVVVVDGAAGAQRSRGMLGITVRLPN